MSRFVLNKLKRQNSFKELKFFISGFSSNYETEYMIWLHLKLTRSQESKIKMESTKNKKCVWLIVNPTNKNDKIHFFYNGDIQFKTG